MKSMTNKFATLALALIWAPMTAYADIIAKPDFEKASSGVPIIIDVLENDTIDVAVAVEIEFSPNAGGMAVVVDNSVEYTSLTNFEGTETFVYRVTKTDKGKKDSATATVTVDVSATKSFIGLGDSLFFNQAGPDPVPDARNPLTATSKNTTIAGKVSIACCRVLDTRENLGDGREFGQGGRANFDIGANLADKDTNPTCVDMPYIGPDRALLRPWHRGVPLSKAKDIDPDIDPEDLRENDIGVCHILSKAKSDFVFSAEEAQRVVGYSVDCTVPSIDYRPITAGVSLDPVEVDAPFVTPWTADCDESRSVKRYSELVMVLPVWHDISIKPTSDYLSGLTSALKKSIVEFKLECPAANDNGFLNRLTMRVESAENDIKTGDPEQAVKTLYEATRLAMLIDPYEDEPDPYVCPEINALGLFAGRLLSATFATCSEMLHADSNSSSLNPDGSPNLSGCRIPNDIFAELPDLPGFENP